MNKWNIPNGVGKISNKDIDQLPLPFIAYTHHGESPLAIVTQMSETSIDYYSKNYNNRVAEKREDFLQKWSGVYLIAEPTGHSGEAEYNKKRRKYFIRSLLLPVALMISLIGGSFFLLLSGVIVTSLLLWYEIDRNNPALQKVCTGIAKGDCNDILTGKQSKLFNWLSWSEVGFFYFSGSLLSLLFAGNNIFNSLAALSWLNILALPYTLFSVYYQWRVVKQYGNI